MSGVRATRVLFSKENLKAIPEEQLGFLVLAAHISNELSSLRNIMIFEGREDSDSEFAKAQTAMRWMTLLRVALAKIVEFHDCIDRFTGSLKRRASQSDVSEFVALRKTFLGSEQPQWLRLVRNKLAFHFDLDHALACLNQVPQDKQLAFFLTPRVGDTSFSFAEEILSNPLFLELGRNEEIADASAGANVLFDFFNRRTAEIIGFVHRFFEYLFEKYGVPTESSETDIPSRLFADPEVSSNPLLINRPSV
jgi:hypothetical protein